MCTCARLRLRGRAFAYVRVCVCARARYSARTGKHPMLRSLVRVQFLLFAKMFVYLPKGRNVFN